MGKIWLKRLKALFSLRLIQSWNLLSMCAKMALKAPGMMFFGTDPKLEFIEYVCKDGSKGSRYDVLWD